MERSESIGITQPRQETKPFSWYDLALPLSERRALLIGGDVIIGVVAAVIAFWVWKRFYPHAIIRPGSVHEQIKWLRLLGIGWLILIAVNEGYNLRVAARSRQIARVLFLSTVELAVLYLLAFFIWGRPIWQTLLEPGSPFSSLPRLTPAIFMLLSLLLSLLWRLAYTLLFTSALLRRRAIVVGCGRAGLALVQDIQQVALDYEIVGFVDDDPSKQGQHISDLPVLGDRYDLVRLVQQQGANEVILAVTHEIQTDLFKALMDCAELGVKIKPMATVYEEVLGRVPVEHLGQKWYLAPLWTNGSMPTLYRATRRVVDIALALVGLVVLVAFLPFVLLTNYLGSPGPVFYSQERIGKGGRTFRIYKLRSMIPDAEEEGEAVWATEDDPRVTPIGRFLRRTRLDELPQLLNVLKGDMSIVGPRPERPQFVGQLQEKIPFYRTRLSVKPGVTGWAQIKYPYGNSVEDALVKLQYDLYYIKRQSLLLDTLIMLRTIKVMLAFRGT